MLAALCVTIVLIPLTGIVTVFVVRKMLHSQMDLIGELIAQRAKEMSDSHTRSALSIREHVANRTNHLADTVSELADATRAVLKAAVREPATPPPAGQLVEKKATATRPRSKSAALGKNT